MSAFITKSRTVRTRNGYPIAESMSAESRARMAQLAENRKKAVAAAIRGMHK